MINIAVKEEAFIRKDLLSIRLTDAMALLAFPGVALVPLKAGNLAEVRCGLHLPVKLQGTDSGFNPARLLFLGLIALKSYHRAATLAANQQERPTEVDHDSRNES